MSFASEEGKLISLLSRLDERQRSELEEQSHSDMVVQCSEQKAQGYAMATEGEDENSPYMCACFGKDPTNQRGKPQHARRKETRDITFI